VEIQPLSPKQRESIRLSNARINIWEGSVRSGKTFATYFRFADECVQGPPGPFVVMGKTHDTLKRNILDPMIEIFGPAAVKVWHGKREARIFGRKVYLAGANNLQAEDKIRGMTAAGALGDELTLWPEEVFNMLMTRLSVTGAKFFGTTNPDSPLHWLKKNWLDKAAEKGVARFPFKLRDNTALSQEFIQALEREHVGLWKKRMIDGLWVIAEGAIWDMFLLDPEGDRGAHVVDAVPANLKFHRYVVAIDYGTRNPFVALLIGQGNDGRFWILDEWRWDSATKQRQKDPLQYALALKDWVADKQILVSKWFVDPSELSFILTLRKQVAGKVESADNRVEDGLKSVATLLTHDKVRILRCCEGLIEEISSYVWDPDKQEKGIDAPLKVADHGPDAFRYGVHSQYGIWKNWIRQVAA
jgi:PBSX family phage terminase large subunit